MRACGQCGSNDGTQIVWIFDAIEQDDEPDLAAPRIRACENSFQSGGGARSGKGDDALVIFRIGKAVELTAFLEAHWNALLARELQDFLDARVLPALGDSDAVDGALRFERFFHRVNAR